MDTTQPLPTPEVMEEFDGWKVLKGAMLQEIAAMGMCFLVPAWRIVIPRFEEFEIVVHKSINFSDDWCVTEGITGLQICNGASLDDAIYSTKAYFEQRKITPEWFREKIQSSIAMLGRLDSTT